MRAQKTSHPKPTWLKAAHRRIIGHSAADLYAYLCAFGPNTCNSWNCRLAKEFGVNTRTAARWIQRLQELGLIHIENPGSPYRKLHPIYFRTAAEFYRSAQIQELRKKVKKIGSTNVKPEGHKCPGEIREDSLRSSSQQKVCQTTGTASLSPPEPPEPHPCGSGFKSGKKQGWQWKKNQLKALDQNSGSSDQEQQHSQTYIESQRRQREANSALELAKLSLKNLTE